MIANDRKIGEQLRGRILGAFPAAHYALDSFFNLTDIVISDKTDTAAVECLSQPRMLLNEKFLADHCKTDEHLFMLVMHELHHILLGHTRLFKKYTPIDNIAFDAVINSILSQLFPDPMYISFFQKLYKPDTLPDALLRPPDGWPSQWNIPEILPKKAGEIIRTLYSPTSGTYQEIYDLLKNDQELKNALAQAGVSYGPVASASSDNNGQNGNGTGEGEKQDSGNGDNDRDSEDNNSESNSPGNGNKGFGTILLGDHSPGDTPGRHNDVINNPIIKDALKETVKKLIESNSDQYSKGRSIGGEIKDIFLKEVPKIPQDELILKKFVKKMVESSKKGATTKKIRSFDNRIIEAPIPRIRDRRAFFLSVMGLPPMIYRDDSQQRKIIKEKGLTTIYVDVSGSTGSYWNMLASLVRPYVMRGLVRLFAFSEKVVDVTPENLSKGKFKTTGGTDGNCIWKHAIDNKFKKIIILTDGDVGKPDKKLIDQLEEKRIRIRAILTPDGMKEDIKEVCEEIVKLPRSSDNHKEEDES